MKRLLLLLFLISYMSVTVVAQYVFKESKMFSVKVNGKPIFVEYYKTVDDQYDSNGNLIWKIENVSLSHFFFTGEVEVEVIVNASFTNYNLSPKRYGIESTREGNTIKFKVNRPIKLNINMNNEDVVNEQLFLFADALEDKPRLSSPNVKNILSYTGANNSGKLEITNVIQGAIDGLSAGDVLYFPPGQYLTKSIKLKSNITIYLEAGAILLGTGEYYDYSENKCMVLIENCENTSIKGYGRINFRGEQMQIDHGDRTWVQIVNILGGSNNNLEDFFSVDPPVGNMRIEGDYTTVYNLKALANQNFPTGDNTDGLTPRFSKHTIFDNCLIYGRDDNYVVKVSFDNFVAVNSILSTFESTQKIGTETEGERIENIVFENNDAIHIGHAMSIWSRDGAEINNIWFRNIGVERIKPSPYPGQGMPFYFTILPRDGSNPGNVTDVFIQNVTCETEGKGIDRKSFIAGNDEDSKFINIEFKNLVIADSLVTQTNYKKYFQVGIDEWRPSYVENLSFGTEEFAIVEVKVDDIDITEGENSTFTITRKGDLSPAFSVEYWIRGTAENGVDYSTIPNSVVFSSGQALATVIISSITDSIAERIEQVYISLKNEADQKYMLGPVFNAMINIRDIGFTENIIISDPLYPGTESSGRIEAENMELDNYEVESNETASEKKLIKALHGNVGTATFISDRVSANYNINTIYIAEEDGTSAYKIYINDTEVDSWTAAQTSTQWEFLIHTTNKVFISYGDIIKIEGTPNEGASGRLDYIELVKNQDKEPPIPNPMTFSILPYGSGTTHITMSAKAFDLSSVEYYFENVTYPSHSSSWQDDTLFVDTGLNEDTKYTYRVKARDKSASNNETDYSDTASASTNKESIGIDSTFVGQDGIYVMEAENAIISLNNDTAGWTGPVKTMWYEEATEQSYVGTGYMTTQKGVSYNAKWKTGTELAWPVEITESDEYWIAIRRIAKDEEDDSGFFGVDGIACYSGDRAFTGTSTSFTWIHGNKSLGNLAKGVRMIQVRRREDGMMIDRVMIANSEDKLPAEGSAEKGPPESHRGNEVAIGEVFRNNSVKFNAAYPNPFNQRTIFSYSLTQVAVVRITIYDIMGRKIKTLLNEKQSIGNHRVIWNANNDNVKGVSPGVYVFRISVGNSSNTGRLYYLK